jgi:hypothetical protein
MSPAIRSESNSVTFLKRRENCMGDQRRRPCDFGSNWVDTGRKNKPGMLDCGRVEADPGEIESNEHEWFLLKYRPI